MGAEHTAEMSEEDYESSVPSCTSSMAPWAGLDGSEEEEEEDAQVPRKGHQAHRDAADTMQTKKGNGVTAPTEGTECGNEIYRNGQWIYRGERQGDDNVWRSFTLTWNDDLIAPFLDLR